MRKILFIGLSVLMIISFHNTAAAAEIAISGSAQFDCSLIAKYMIKHGYYYLGHTNSKYDLGVNTYSAKDAKVIIMDKYSTAIGTGWTDKKGKFYITVPKKDVYKVVVRYHDKVVREIVLFPDIKNIKIDVGFFSSEEAGGWL